jgi:hypothetical protein
LRRGVTLVRYRGGAGQADVLETWLSSITHEYADSVLLFDAAAAQVWGRLRVPDPAHDIYKRVRRRPTPASTCGADMVGCTAAHPIITRSGCPARP